MSLLFRRRLPPSVRSLLTDIGPKEEWTDTEAESVERDGILLPSRRAACEQEEFLVPYTTQKRETTEDSSNNSIAICMLCKSKPSCYTCPRCNLQYCGLACYQSPDHSVCSEEFYKESVLQELKNMGKTENEGKRKMQEILMGLRQKANRTEGGMETLLKEAGILSDDTDTEEREATEKAQAVELLSRLAEIQQFGEPNATEIEDIFRKFGEMEGCDLPGIEASENVEEELDVADRLSGLNIDKLSEEDLWELLSSKEKETFLGLVKGGALGKLVPLWKPWWEEHEGGRGSLVEILSDAVGIEPEIRNSKTLNVETSQEMVQKRDKTKTKLKKNKGGECTKVRNTDEGIAISSVPPISAKIPKLSSVCTNPSPLVCYRLVNALFGYTFTLGLFNGDTESLRLEFCDMILALAEALNTNRVFNSVQDALDSGESLILGGGYFDKEDPLASARAIEAVAHIMTGRDRKDAIGYCLAALSQLRSLFSQARKSMSKEGEEGVKRQKYFLTTKTCEFFQAWVMDNTQQVHRVAIELWNEHSRRESGRNSLKKAKTVIEEKLKKGKIKGNDKMIEELS